MDLPDFVFPNPTKASFGKIYIGKFGPSKIFTWLIYTKKTLD